MPPWFVAVQVKLAAAVQPEQVIAFEFRLGYLSTVPTRLGQTRSSLALILRATMSQVASRCHCK